MTSPRAPLDWVGTASTKGGVTPLSLAPYHRPPLALTPRTERRSLAHRPRTKVA